MNHFVVRKSVLVVCFSLVVYYIILELYYYYFVGISYLKFKMDLHINVEKYIETKLLLVFMLAFSLYVSKKSEFIYSIFIFFCLFFFIPGLVTYSFEDQIAAPLYFTILLLLSLGLISTQKIKLPTIQTISFSRGAIIVIVFFLLLPFFYFYRFYFDINNLLLNDIDKTRGVYVERSSVLIDYLYNWLVRAVMPVLLVYFLLKRNYRYAFVSLFILFYLYVVSGNKTVYITVFVMIFFYSVGKDHLEKTKIFLYALILFLLLAPVIDAYILESHMLKGTFVMRMLFLPSHLNYFYFDLFDNNPLYFSESNFFKWFSHYPFSRPVGFVISEIYFSAPDMNSNNGVISDGFMNLGYLGILLNIFLISSVFLFFNSLPIDSRYLGIFFLMVFLFLSSPMLSMFITSGLWILIPLAMTLKNRLKSFQ